MEKLISNHNAYKIMIDHHQSPSINADQILSNVSIFNCRIVFEFINSLIWIILRICNCLIYRIVTDRVLLSMI